MTKQTRRIFAAFLAAVLLLGVGVAAIIASRPTMPGEWAKIRLGMPRAEALTLLPDEVTDMRQFKSFDETFRETTMFGISCYWQLLIYYDDKNQVKEAVAGFTCRDYGFLSTERKAILR